MLKRLLASKRNPYIPGLENMDRLSINLSGSEFIISMPPHSGSGRAKLQSRVNIYDPNIYDSLEGLKEHQRGAFPTSLLAQRDFWLLGQPWLSDSIGSMLCTALVINTSNLDDGHSCFDPSSFERIILRQLYFDVGPGGTGSESIAPVNWRAESIHDTQWVRCEVLSDPSQRWPGGYSAAQLRSLLYTPLDDHHFLAISFSGLGYQPVENSNRAMWRIIGAVCSSLELRLCTAVTERRQDVLRMKRGDYSNKREPEEWVYPTFRFGDQDAGESFQVMVTPGSPPPTIA